MQSSELSEEVQKKSVSGKVDGVPTEHVFIMQQNDFMKKQFNDFPTNLLIDCSHKVFSKINSPKLV